LVQEVVGERMVRADRAAHVVWCVYDVVPAKERIVKQDRLDVEHVGPSSALISSSVAGRCLLDTLWALVLPSGLFNGFGVFLLRRYVKGIPLELEEAGRTWTFVTIVPPLLRTPLVALGIFISWVSGTRSSTPSSS
jgi:hypothetical protein